MAFPSLSSLFKGKGPEPGKGQKPEMLECPRCGRFFAKKAHAHEPLCRDCWKLTKADRPS